MYKKTVVQEKGVKEEDEIYCNSNTYGKKQLETTSRLLHLYKENKSTIAERDYSQGISDFKLGSAFKKLTFFFYRAQLAYAS